MLSCLPASLPSNLFCFLKALQKCLYSVEIYRKFLLIKDPRRRCYLRKRSNQKWTYPFNTLCCVWFPEVPRGSWHYCSIASWQPWQMLKEKSGDQSEDVSSLNAAAGCSWYSIVLLMLMLSSSSMFPELCELFHPNVCLQSFLTTVTPTIEACVGSAI